MSPYSPGLVASRYRLERRIAAGGMGEVWQATDQALGRQVAVKLLRADLAEHRGARERFHAEARAAARLTHPGVVGVFDLGDQDGVPYLVMELVHGEALSALLDRHGVFEPAEAMSIVAQTASVLAAAHALGIGHLDVKPAKLLVRPDGRVKVTHFGVAQAADGSTPADAGTVPGTAYMSPEQVRGDVVSDASDVYSLGVVAYECLTGDRPFGGDESVTVAIGHLQRAVPPLPASVPTGVKRLVTAMLEKDPARRPSSARAVADAAARLATSVSAAPRHAPSHGRRDEEPEAQRAPWAAAEGAEGAGALRKRHRGGRLGRLSRRGRATATLATAAAVMLVTGVVLTAGAAPSSVRVPSLRGDLQPSALAALVDEHLAVENVTVDVAGATADLVVGQGPLAGARVKPGPG